jgi:spore maturation protein CgeB
MHFVLFYPSLVSDWDNGDAHFLRGLVRELQIRGHSVDVYEPRDGASLRNLIAEHGRGPLRDFEAFHPTLQSATYEPDDLDLDVALREADVVIVHESSDPAFAERIGQHRARRGAYLLFFHDPHDRSVTAPDQLALYNLADYDAVLAGGRAICDVYLARGWTRRAQVWLAAADARVFRPRTEMPRIGDLVWIGNWDEQRDVELREFLIEPVRALGLTARVYGVRYPEAARAALAAANIEYCGWLPNFRVPVALGQFRLTVHIPRRSYLRQLPGVPTIRLFEALACGMPLVSACWQSTDGLFTPGRDFLVAQDGAEMATQLRELLNSPIRASAIGEHGRLTVLGRHTCRHRVDELLAFCAELGGPTLTMSLAERLAHGRPSLPLRPAPADAELPASALLPTPDLSTPAL